MLYARYGANLEALPPMTVFENGQLTERDLRPSELIDFFDGKPCPDTVERIVNARHAVVATALRKSLLLNPPNDDGMDVILRRVNDHLEVEPWVINRMPLHNLPTCDICREREAYFDAKTIEGPWGYMCDGCFAERGLGLGEGLGQQLRLPWCAEATSNAPDGRCKLLSLRESVFALRPNQRVWVNDEGGEMIGGVTREPDGSWTVYDFNSTNDSEGSEEALDDLLNIVDSAVNPPLGLPFEAYGLPWGVETIGNA